MLTINLEHEEFNEETCEFLDVKDGKLVLEHSLISISKWEAIHHRSFISHPPTNKDETLSYVKCMTITSSGEDVYEKLTPSDLRKIDSYISDSMTATYFKDHPGKNQSREVVTSELIYYWMISLGIPFECQKWHLNRLLTLIKVANIKNSPPKKMSVREMAAQNRMLNARRKQQLNTTG